MPLAHPFEQATGRRWATWWQRAMWLGGTTRSSSGACLEHWDNAARQADAAASTLLAGPNAGRPYAEVPWFWSNQYDTKLQFVGTAQPGDQVEVVEGSTEGRRFVAAYGREGRTVGALVLNRSTVAGSYRRLIAERAAFPPRTE